MHYRDVEIGKYYLVKSTLSQSKLFTVPRIIKILRFKTAAYREELIIYDENEGSLHCDWLECEASSLVRELE